MLQLHLVRAQLCLLGTFERVANLFVAILTRPHSIRQQCLYDQLTTFVSGNATRQQQLFMAA